MRRIGVLMNLAADDPEARGPHRGVPAGAAAIGLDRRPQRADRLSLGRGRCRAHSQICGGIGRARAGRHPGRRRPAVAAVAAGDPHRADRVRAVSPIRSAAASSRAWRGRAATPPALPLFEYGMSGKWLELLKEIAPRRDAGGGPSRSCQSCRDRPVGRNPGGGAVARGGVEPDRRARRRRDRARRSLAFARGSEWRPDRDREPVGGSSSRADHRAGGSAPAARGLLLTATSSPPAA